MKINKNESGVLTLEASILVPIFVIIMLMLNGMFVMYMGQQTMAHATFQTAKSMAFDPYENQKTGAVGSSILDFITKLSELSADIDGMSEEWYEDTYTDLETVVKERFEMFLATSDVTGFYNTVGVSNVDFSGCTVVDGVLTVKIKYKQSYIYADFVAKTKELTATVKLFESK